MATTIQKFNGATKMILGGIDLDTTTLKLALVTSSYTLDLTDAAWSDISGSEVATGDGYTTGGETLGTPTLTTSGAVCTFDAEDVTWTSLTKTFRAGVVYASGTFETILNPVLFYILFDDTPADRVINNINFIVQWHSSGILAI